MTHEWRARSVDFCERCGMSRMEAVEAGSNECDAPANMRSMVPALREQQVRELLAPVIARLKAFETA